MFELNDYFIVKIKCISTFAYHSSSWNFYGKISYHFKGSKFPKVEYDVNLSIRKKYYIGICMCFMFEILV